MESFTESQLVLALPSTTAVAASAPAAASTSMSYEELLECQRSLFCSQIDQLENIVVRQCQLTGVNPLSQEMAAGALSIKIGKRPRDLLNPKAVKYMQELFSIKDAITKKEIREISALFGITATQVREFFTTQKSRVRKFMRLSKEKASRSNSVLQDGVSSNSDPIDTVTPVPLNSLDPVSVEEAPTCSSQDEELPGLDESDKHFVTNIFMSMRREESFSGQVKLMDRVLQVHNPSVLDWFLSKGGVMILATWLTQAAVEEQISVLHIILKVLCHLPLQKALPVHMSAILQSVNKLRFYRASDISNRARILLSRWSKMFARSQALKKPNGVKSANEVQDEMLLKQSINEVMGNATWDSNHDGSLVPLNESLDNSRKKFEPPQPLKMLTASADDSNKKLLRGGLSSHGRQRRKVQMVEQPGQKTTGRSFQVTKSIPSTQARPLSADDIQKAKMRAQFLQSKYGKNVSSSNESPQMQPESSKKCTPSVANISHSTSQASIEPKIEDQSNPENIPSCVATKQEVLDSKMILGSEEPLLERCKRLQIPWKTPPGFEINPSWEVGSGVNSKEVEVQKNRIRRERETIYITSHEIPSDPKEPWDREMDYDDSLTPELPTEQLPDIDGVEPVASPSGGEGTAVPSASASSQNAGNSSLTLEPDLELLAVLLKNPDLVFALTSGQANNLSSEETVKLLDMIKANEMNSLGSASGVGRQAEKVEVSLPSPTPASDPVTSGWKNPFTRQTIAVRGGGAPLHSQENLATASLMQKTQIPSGSISAQQLSSSVHQLAQETVPQMSMVQPSTGLTPVMNILQQQVPVATSHLLAASELNMRSTSAFPNLVGSSSPAGQASPYEPDPPLSHSWQGYDAVSYYQGSANKHSYSENVREATLTPAHSWERNDQARRGGEYQSWSPDRSPVGSRDYGAQRHYPASRVNLGHNYRLERPVSRNPGYPHVGSGYSGPYVGDGSGYADPEWDGSQWRRDRRR